MFDFIESKSMVVELPVEYLHAFPAHPYQVRFDTDMQQLVDSIREYGVMSPILVRYAGHNQGYEVISGHRRLYACNLLGLKMIPSIVHDISHEEAAILLVDSNLHREKLLPSEKAYAYRLKMDALRHQGQRTDLTSLQLEHKLESAALIAQQHNESASQVRRYLRLTQLIPELLEMVDMGHIAFTPAVNLSYLTHEQQYWLLDGMRKADCTPSLSQSITMKNQSKAGTLTPEYMTALLAQSKPNQIEYLRLPLDDIRSCFPRSFSPEQISREILRMCKERCHKQMEREAR